MPLFEFRCLACEKRFTFLAGVIADNEAARCPRCASTDLKKLMSRFGRGRSDDDRMDAMAEKLESCDLDDAAQARRFAREMGREMGQESGEDLSDEIEALIESEARDDDAQSTLGASDSRDDGTIY